MRELTQHGAVNVSHLASLLSVAEGSGVGGVREFGATQEVLLAPVSSDPLFFLFFFWRHVLPIPGSLNSSIVFRSFIHRLQVLDEDDFSEEVGWDSFQSFQSYSSSFSPVRPNVCHL